MIDEATARALGASPVPGAVWAFASAGAAPCAMQPGRFLLDHEPGRDGGYYRISQELTGACLDDSNHDVPAFITAQAPTLCRYTTASWATGDGKQGDTPPQQLRGWLTKRGCDILCNVIWTTHDAAFGEGGAVRGVQARLYEQRGVVPGAMHLLEMRAHAEAPWTPLTGAETFDGIFTDDRGLRGLTSGRGSSVLQIIPIGPESPQRVNLRPAPDQE